MNLNDPFGRMASRQQRDYESLRAALKKAGVTDRAQAEAIHANLGKRCKLGILIAVPLAVALVLFFPQAQVVFIALGALFVLWLVNATRNGQRYLRRYIEEELVNAPPTDEKPKNEP